MLRSESRMISSPCVRTLRAPKQMCRHSDNKAACSRKPLLLERKTPHRFYSNTFHLLYPQSKSLVSTLPNSSQLLTFQDLPKNHWAQALSPISTVPALPLWALPIPCRWAFLSVVGPLLESFWEAGMDSIGDPGVKPPFKVIIGLGWTIDSHLRF